MCRPVSSRSHAIVYGIWRDQPHRGAAHRVQAPLGLGDAELGALAGDADVGALQDLGAARDGRALDGGDQRLGQPAALQQARRCASGRSRRS